MTSNEIKKEFLRFFEERGHKIVPSSSLIPDDPTLLLTTAGMVQFKPYFLNIRKPQYSRAASVQKCVRTTDIDLVGHTARHLTFFEMLGNFSFGDYYKAEVVPWAWELITEVFKMDPDKLWISVFLDDDEAFDIWNRKVGVAENRIVRLGEEHNFWAAGPTGPCGPCSEIHYDFGQDKACGPDCRLGCDCDRFLEVWNLVFMEFNRDENGALSPLPNKNIDTGIGVERTALVLQNACSNFDTDHLRPLISKTEQLSGVSYGSKDNIDISLRIIADHSRAITFMVGDGIMPGNEGRGYILRRLLRRAARHGKVIGIEEDFLSLIVDEVIANMSSTYPELTDNHAYIRRIIETEEHRFSTTLRQGMSILADECSNLKRQGIQVVSGEAAFRLYDTYGFPFEITKEIADESGLAVDEPSFRTLMDQQRQRAKQGAAFAGAHAEIGKRNIYDELGDRLDPSEFLGYDQLESETVIDALIFEGALIERLELGQKGSVILRSTPFYGEQGGQVGDTGLLIADEGKFHVLDTRIEGAFYVHEGEVIEGRLDSGCRVTAKVDIHQRESIARNHTATHLLHWSLREVLGDHVKQSGSLVSAERLRFDFSHYEAISSEELTRIEDLVNEKIFSGYQVKCYTTSLDYAKSIGATAIFGEKYGEFVRIVESGDFSKELCGGTHVAALDNIRLFVITHEGSVGANLRRIEALTGAAALDYLRGKAMITQDISHHLKVAPENTLDRIKHLESELKRLQKESAKGSLEDISEDINALTDSSIALGPYKFIKCIFSNKGIDHIRSISDGIRDRIPEAIIAMGSDENGKALIVVSCGSKAISEGARANLLIASSFPYIDGKGGGKDTFAQAGGAKVAGIAAALSAIQETIERSLDENPST